MNYKREYKKYLTASVLDTANNKIASSSFISAFAVYLGLSDLAIGIYAVLDTITNIVQIFAATFFGRFGQSKKVVLTNYAIYRIVSVCFAFIPFISDNITVRTIFFFIFASIYAVTGELGYVTFERFIEGIVTAVLPILSYTIFKESSNAIKITFGLAIVTYIILFVYFKSSDKKQELNNHK